MDVRELATALQSAAFTRQQAEALLKIVSATAASGIPVGGATGQALTKASGADNDTEWTTPPGASASIELLADQFVRAALVGDVTASANSNVTEIANGVVTNAKAANMDVGTIKGRATAGTGSPEDLTAAQVAAIIDLSIRNVPVVYNPGSIDLSQAHMGRCIAKTSSTAQTITIRPNDSAAIENGTAVTFANMGGTTGNLVIARGIGVALYRAGASADITLAPGNTITALKLATDTWQV